MYIIATVKGEVAMRPRKQFSESEKESIRNVKTQWNRGRVQAIAGGLFAHGTWTFGQRPSENCLVCIRRVFGGFIRISSLDGAEIFVSGPHGGRRHFNLSIAEEESVLKPFLKKGRKQRNHHRVFGSRCLRRETGRAVPSSTVYRALGRHGWRKLVPRPSHPKLIKKHRNL